MFANFRENAGACAGAFETSESAVKRFIFFDMDFCHYLFPSFASGPELKNELVLRT